MKLDQHRSQAADSLFRPSGKQLYGHGESAQPRGPLLVAFFVLDNALNVLVDKEDDALASKQDPRRRMMRCPVARVNRVALVSAATQ